MATGVASAQAITLSAPTGAVPWPASASVAHLKVNGSVTVASLAMKINTIANSTRALRSRRSAGQTKGQRWTSIDTNAARSAVTSRFWLAGAAANSFIQLGNPGAGRGMPPCTDHIEILSRSRTARGLLHLAYTACARGESRPHLFF